MGVQPRDAVGLGKVGIGVGKRNTRVGDGERRRREDLHLSSLVSHKLSHNLIIKKRKGNRAVFSVAVFTQHDLFSPAQSAQRAMASSSSSGTAGGRVVLSKEGATAMAECIGLLFGRWTALQLAVQNRWGGLDSQAKADRLASSVLSWFTRAAARGLDRSLVSLFTRAAALHYCCLSNLIKSGIETIPPLLMKYD
jgi:hypothetical protein